MDFPQDQLVLFKAFDADGGVSARYGVFDLGSGTIDAITAGACHKKGEGKMVYYKIKDENIIKLINDAYKHIEVAK